MSTNPNDPFQDASATPTAPTKSRRGCLFGCLIASGIVLLICCGGGYWAYSFVSNQIGAEVQRRVTGNPIVEEQIGEVQSVRIEWGETITQSQKAQEDGRPGVLIFSVDGSEGSGQLVVDQDASNQPDFDSITLVTEDGSRFPLNASDNDVLDDIESQLENIEAGISVDTGELESSPPESDDTSTDDTPPTDEAEPDSDETTSATNG